MINKNYYEILGLSNDCTPNEIKKSYHQLALIWHPDKHDNKKEAELTFTFINEAYKVLSDATQRNLYDVQRQRTSELNETFKEYSNAFDTSIFQTQGFSNLDRTALDILRNILEDKDDVNSNNSNMLKDFNTTIRNFIHQEVISSDDDLLLSEYQPTFMDKSFTTQYNMFNKCYQGEDDSAQYFATIIEEIPETSTLKRRKSSIIIIGKTEKSTINETTKPSYKSLSKSKGAILKLDTGSKRSFIYNEEQDNFDQQPQKKVKRPQFRLRTTYYSEESATEDELNVNFNSISENTANKQAPITIPLSLQDLRKRLQNQN